MVGVIGIEVGNLIKWIYGIVSIVIYYKGRNGERYELRGSW